MRTKMKMNPKYTSQCPRCEAKITGQALLANKVNPKQTFYCPDCEGVLTYTLIKEFPALKIMLHYAGDPKDIYGANASGDLKVPANKPIRLKKTVVVQTARAYLNGDMGTKSGKVIPDRSPCTILNVHMTGDNTEVMFDDKSLTALPTVQIPKARLLLGGEEIDQSIISMEPTEQPYIELSPEMLERLQLLEHNLAKEELQPARMRSLGS